MNLPDSELNELHDDFMAARSEMLKLLNATDIHFWRWTSGDILRLAQRMTDKHEAFYEAVKQEVAATFKTPAEVVRSSPVYTSVLIIDGED